MANIILKSNNQNIQLLKLLVQEDPSIIPLGLVKFQKKAEIFIYNQLRGFILLANRANPFYRENKRIFYTTKKLIIESNT